MKKYLQSKAKHPNFSSEGNYWRIEMVLKPKILFPNLTLTLATGLGGLRRLRFSFGNLLQMFHHQLNANNSHSCFLWQMVTRKSRSLSIPVPVCMEDWQWLELNICPGGHCHVPLCAKTTNPFIPFCRGHNWTVKLWLVSHGWVREYWPLLVLLSWLNVSRYHCLVPRVWWT